MFFGLNILGIGILIDSIYTIKKIVFDTRKLHLKDLHLQAKQNFNDEQVYKLVAELDGAYGSNSNESNMLANEISDFIASVAIDNPIGEKVLVSPALFQFTADIWQREYPATINGRKQGELLTYGIAPCATPHSHSVTDVLLSAANIKSEKLPNGCPMMISFERNAIKNDDCDFITALIKSYFQMGGFHFAANVVDASLLTKAKENPSEYQELMIKISGLSAKFVTLNDAMQDALIERVKSGI